MTLALDTDVLVHWSIADATHHDAIVAFLRVELSQPDGRIALAPQVCWEFVHVVTDGRRFQRPLTMAQAAGRVRDWWDAPETVRVSPSDRVVHRTLELMDQHHLGRKRILDTVLAATLESAGIEQLATLNDRDFRAFSFLDVVDPRKARVPVLEPTQP